MEPSALDAIKSIELSEDRYAALSQSLLAAKDYMTEDQLQTAETFVPNLRIPQASIPLAVPKKRWSRKSLFALLGLLLTLIQIVLNQLPNQQLERLADQNEIIIEQNYEMIEQKDEELEILQSLLTAAQEVSDALDEVSEEEDDTITEEDAPDASDSPEEVIS